MQLSNSDLKETMTHTVGLRLHLDKIQMLQNLMIGSPLADKEAHSVSEIRLEQDLVPCSNVDGRYVPCYRASTQPAGKKGNMQSERSRTSHG